MLYYFWFEHKYQGGQMSQLIDRIKKVTGVAPQAMGFRVAREAAEKPRILLIASVEPDKLEGRTTGLAETDAVVLRVSGSEPATKAVRETCKLLSGVPCGLWSPAGGGENTTEIADAGADFIVLSTSVPVAKLKEGKLGKLLEVHSPMEAGLLRAVNELPVDAVLVSSGQGKEATLTCQDLLFFHLCAGLMEKNLLASVPLSVAADELQILWEAGISGIMVEIEDKASLEKLASLRAEIDKAVFPARRKGRKMEAVLPATGGVSEAQEEEEEEEEEQQITPWETSSASTFPQR
jgi:hypothetical protein